MFAVNDLHSVEIKRNCIDESSKSHTQTCQLMLDSSGEIMLLTIYFPLNASLSCVSIIALRLWLLVFRRQRKGESANRGKNKWRKRKGLLKEDEGTDAA